MIAAAHCCRRAGGAALARPLAAACARGFHSLPVVDVSPFTQKGATKEDKMAVASQLDDACRRVGFFYVVNHGIRDEVLRGVRDRAREWFSLPSDVKNQIMLSKATNYRGYQELGANVTRYDGGFQRDWHEAIDLYKEAMVSCKARDLRGINPWPTQVPGFKPALDDYVGEMTRLGEGIMRGVAMGLGLPEEFFGGERAGDPYWCIRVIHYPPLPATPERAVAEDEGGADGLGEISRETQLSCGEHTDYGLLTMVNQDEGVSALEVKNAQGQWVSADPIPGALVCNLGDMLKVWTNVVEPLPELLSVGEQARYPAIRYGDHLANKVHSNFEIDR